MPPRESNMDFEAKMKEYADLVNRRLDEYVPQKDNLQKEVYEAMRYSIFAGGKRIRPIIAMGVCEMLGGELSAVIPYACGIECIHTYSLIHDDLPCMDNDDMRRGKPTCHKAFGEANALLAGDALLNRAFEIMSFYGENAEITAEVIKCVSVNSGTEGMIGGQVVDLLCENTENVSYETLGYIHRRKTGALIIASALAGAICANADEKTMKCVESFAENLGLAFQIKDDILDVCGNEKVLGKPTGSDEENHKTTFVTLIGIDRAKEELKRTTSAAKAALSTFGAENEFLCSLADFLLKRDF